MYIGPQTWPNENIRKADVTVSKNYLAASEVKELNRLTTILLDIFEDQIDIGKLVAMKDAETLLESQLRQLNRMILRHGGRVTAVKAKQVAEEQYVRFDANRKKLRHEEADRLIKKLKEADRELPKGPRRPKAS